MFLRVASLISCLMAPVTATAQVLLSFDATVADLEVRATNLLDEHLSGVCQLEAAALDTFYPESNVSKVFPLSIVEMLHKRKDADPLFWRFSPLLLQDLDQTFDATFVNTAALVILKADYALKALEFMAEFSSNRDINILIGTADLQTLRSEVVASKELADCLRANEVQGSSAKTEELRINVNASHDEGNHCIQFDYLVQRYVDIPFDGMTVAERVDAGDRAFSDHDAYLIDSGIAEECEEDA